MHLFDHWTGDGETFIEQMEGRPPDWLVGPKAKRCCVIQAVDWVEANKIYNKHMGWAPYKPMCESCNGGVAQAEEHVTESTEGRLYYHKRCWRVPVDAEVPPEIRERIQDRAIHMFFFVSILTLSILWLVSI